ncbi:MAG: hypothetical protein V4721_10550 [Bacteroidota bacterium]
MGHDNTVLRTEILKRHHQGATDKAISDDLGTNEPFVEKVINEMREAKISAYMAKRDETIGKQIIATQSIINKANKSSPEFILVTDNEEIRQLAIKLKFIAA